MSKNSAFWKALHSLTHPLSIAAILFLLFNDHWLRHNYPSWFTGKIGDFTWLLFAPFFAAMLFAFIVPRRLNNHTKIVGLFSIAFIGVWFVTAKTIPVVHWLTTETLYFIVGYRGTLRMDVTDLLTLPALLISWYIWFKAAESKVNLKPVAYVAFGLGMLATMANTPGTTTYPAGIISICETENGDLLANSHYYETTGFIAPTETSEFSEASHISYDGGFNWVEYSGTSFLTQCSSTEETVAVQPDNAQIQYRWLRGSYVEKTVDDGETWVQIDDFSELRVEIREYSSSIRFGSYNITRTEYITQFPESGIIHSETGNLVLAMNTEGALVITPEGDSYWVAVGIFELMSLQNPALLGRALDLHKYLLPTLCALILVTAITIIHTKQILTRIWLVVGWGNWCLLVIMAHSAFRPQSARNLPPSIVPPAEQILWGIIAVSSLCFIGLPMTIWALEQLTRYKSVILPLLMTILLASAGYMLPLLMWTQGLIPRYYVAAAFSLFLTGCVLWACYVHYKDKLPERYQPEKMKRKPKEDMSHA